MVESPLCGRIESSHLTHLQSHWSESVLLFHLHAVGCKNPLCSYVLLFLCFCLPEHIPCYIFPLKTHLTMPAPSSPIRLASSPNSWLSGPPLSDIDFFDTYDILTIFHLMQYIAIFSRYFPGAQLVKNICNFLPNLSWECLCWDFCDKNALCCVFATKMTYYIFFCKKKWPT